MLCETVNTELGDVNGLAGIRGGVRGESLYQRSRESYVEITCVSLPLMHYLGASRHHQLCQGVDVITLMFVSVGESGCVQTAAQVNITCLSVI